MVPGAELKAWIKSAIYGIIVFCVFLGYVSVYYGTLHMTAVSAAVAAAAAVMIGSSFALSGIAYYFDFLDREIFFRKYIGLIGYFMALAYSLMLPVVNPDIYFTGIPRNLFSTDYLLGLSAMAILTMMAVISNKKMMLKLGPKRWRHLLQLGYLAYMLLITRAIVIEGHVWIVWFSELKGLPPPRLVISIFAAAVILLRISVTVSKYIKEKKKPKPVPLPAPPLNYTPLDVNMYKH